MALRSKLQGTTIDASADLHVHLRDGPMMEAVVKTIRSGGVDTVYVMPNLNPPITTVQQAVSYQDRLQSLEPNVSFLMSLYLHPSLTPETIREAKKSAIYGVKVYPAGVTTGSAAGVVDFESFYPVFAEMEKEDLVLNLHGECPSSRDITVLNAEEAFLPTLQTLHQRFPRLRIVLEHCTTAAALAVVRACGPTVGATITPHHLFLTVDDWANDPFSFCKPVAKLPTDRTALLRAALSGDPKFFLGSDSAPHPVAAKRGGEDGRAKTAAGVFTQPYVTQLVLDALEQGVERGVLREDYVTAEKLQGFLSRHGRAFYRLHRAGRESITLTHDGAKICSTVGADKGVQVVPFRSGHDTWTVSWHTSSTSPGEDSQQVNKAREP